MLDVHNDDSQILAQKHSVWRGEAMAIAMAKGEWVWIEKSKEPEHKREFYVWIVGN